MCTCSAGNGVLLSLSKGLALHTPNVSPVYFMTQFLKSWTNQLKGANVDDLVLSNARGLVLQMMCAELGTVEDNKEQQVL